VSKTLLWVVPESRIGTLPAIPAGADYTQRLTVARRNYHAQIASDATHTHIDVLFKRGDDVERAPRSTQQRPASPVTEGAAEPTAAGDSASEVDTVTLETAPAPSSTSRSAARGSRNASRSAASRDVTPPRNPSKRPKRSGG